MTGTLYAPPGMPSSFTNGANLVSTFYYDKRMQPCRISVKSSGTAPVSCTDAADIGNVIDFAYNFSLGVADNGNVMGITNNRDTTRSQQFTYDALNRISTAETTSTHATSPANCWGDQFGYDAWGNLLSISPVSSAYTGCTYQPLSVVATASNQISGDTYDAAGNLIVAQPGSTSYTYNAENQLTSTAGVTYKYDGDGKRVEKTSGKLYWYGTGSDPLMETDLSGNLTDEYIFFGGKRIARRDSSGNVVYYVADHLGTSRIVASSAGAILDQSDFYPFGGERIISTSSGNTYKFTGKERDAESGLDNFGARYDSSSLGRFMSPDWSAKPRDVPYADLGNPQSLNLYAYARNNPLLGPDIDGHDPDVTYQNQALEQMFNRIAMESPSFNAELDAAKSDHNIDVTVNQVGAQTLPDHAPGDSTITLNADGSIKVVIRVQLDDEKTSEHEMGHEKDARTNPAQVRAWGAQDSRDKGGPNEKCHDCRLIEQSANKFRDQVERDRKKYRQEQKERKRREKEERKSLSEKPFAPQIY